MALGWSEIRSRATTFAYEWRNAKSERGQSQPFWIEFFKVFGISQKRVAVFEKKVRKLGGGEGFIDMLWKGVLLIEQKSEGKDLGKAYKQATEYFPGLTDDELPRFILVCDFERFHLYDLTENTDIEFSLSELPSKVELFGFMIGFTWEKPHESEKVSIAAAEKMAMLHDNLKTINYSGRKLEKYLVRLLFCLFADATSIFDKGIFRDLIAGTKPDGTDLAQVLADLFDRLNTPFEERLRIEDKLSAFPYVDGGLFADPLPVAAFDSKMRRVLLESCGFDWSFITPSIFGSMFQAAMDEEKREELSAHYTEESNILKIINPLFLDDLNAEFELVKSNTRKLKNFHGKLAHMKFLDPACGTGNFLIIAYRELRRLEIKVLDALHSIDSVQGGSTIQMAIDILDHTKVNVDQFHGIEIDEFACEIARVGMWLMDHQCNMELSKAFGLYYVRLPLEKAAAICNANALKINWDDICPIHELSYIFGNPPFHGKNKMTTEQKTDLVAIITKPDGARVNGAGNIDYVSGWYYIIARLLQRNPSIRAALVSTSSITQGEQVSVLWRTLIEEYKLKIDFAHRTFRWESQARGSAAVHCIIVGFSRNTVRAKPHIFDADLELDAKNINPYLVDAPNMYIGNRSKPLCDVPIMRIGNQPIDGGHYLFTDEEKQDFIIKEPKSAKWFRPWIGADEFIYGYQRYCLWLGDCTPSELKLMPEALKLVEAVQKSRMKSTRASTRKLAETPRRFQVETMPSGRYIVIPEVTSERRKYIPIGFLNSDVLCSNKLKIIDSESLYFFGVLTSEIHMIWMRAVCGRLESRFQYSSGIVYNNFPWPEPSEKQRLAIEFAAQGVLDVRALDQFSGESFDTLYDPTLMPLELAKAHKKLDNAVKNAYSSIGFASEAERLADLMERYKALAEKQ